MSTNKVAPAYASQAKPALASLFAQLTGIGPTSTVEERIAAVVAVARVLQPLPDSHQRFDQDKQDFFIGVAERLQMMAPKPPETNTNAAATQLQIHHIEQEANKASKDMRRKSMISSAKVKERTAKRVAERVLKNMIMFSDCSKDEIKLLVGQMKRRQYHDSDLICTEGEPANEFMVVCSGGATVIQNGERIASLTTKDSIGERVLVSTPGSTQLRAASVIARGDTVVMVLAKDAMDSAELSKTTKHSIRERAQARMQEMLDADAKRLLEQKNEIHHEIEFVSIFLHPPIGLVLEGKDDALRVKGFEGEVDVPDVELGDKLSGVNGVVFKENVSHKERIQVIQKKTWPLKLLFRRVKKGEGPPPPSSISLQFPAPKDGGETRLPEAVSEECVVNVDENEGSDSSDEEQSTLQDDELDDSG